MSIDSFDLAILDALQRDGAMTNAALSEVVNLSPSQCSRRRAALEDAGLIRGYAARLNAVKLGLGFRAITRVNLQSHGQGRDDNFVRFIESQPQVARRSNSTDYSLRRSRVGLRSSSVKRLQ